MNVLLPFPLAYPPLYPLDLLAGVYVPRTMDGLVSCPLDVVKRRDQSPFTPWQSLFPPNLPLSVLTLTLYISCVFFRLSFLIYLGFISLNL